MRKITLIIFICLVSFFAKAQFTTPNYQFSSKTKLMQVLGGLRPDSGFIVSPRFTDTATANLSVVHLYGGMLIRVLDTMWLRNEAATQWNKVGSSSGGSGSSQTWQQTLTTGSTLTGNNTIAGGGFDLKFNNSNFYVGTLGGNSNRLVWNDNTGLLYNTSWQIVSDSLNPYITNLQNGCLSGCIVTWDTLYTYIISPSTYRIGGVYYSSPADTITLAAADPTNDRIDAFVVNTSNANAVVQGTPANPALAPDIDVSTQLQISFAVVSHGTTSPIIDTAAIYKENLGTPTEWTYSDNTATITPSSINFPYQGLVDIEGTTVAASVNFTLTAASSPTFTNYTQLNFKIRSKGSWSTGRGFAIQFLNGSTPIGNPVPFLSGSYNFISATTGVYQNVSIPLADFGNITNATAVRFLRAGTSTIPGFYIDNIILIGGAASGGGTGIQTITASSPITATQTGTAVNISTSMATNKLIGRSTAGTGVMEQITVGSGLSLSGGTLSATGSGGSVTSVGLTSSDITVGGATSPITTSGTYTLTLATVNSNVGTFGDATHVGQFTVNGKGLVTAASNVSITGFASSTLTNTHIFVGNGSNVATDVAASGDLTLANTGAFTFNTVNSNVGTFASVTVNGKGLVTAAANLSGDATTSGAALTLATVNSNVGSFTNASITVNAKGLITAASSGTAPVTTFSAGTTGFTPNSATSGAVTLAGTLVLANGGTSASLTASNGGIFYSTSSAGAILSGTATANKMLLSGATAAPTWSTSTIPSSAGATANKVLLSDGTNYVLSTPTFPNASATSGKIIISDGTNWIASTPTYPSAAGSSGNVLTSDGTNWTSAAPASGGVTTVGTFSASSQTNGASISGSTITFGPSDGTNPGMVSTGTQTMAGDKTGTGAWTFNSTLNFRGLTNGSNTADSLVTINGNQVYKLNMSLASPWFRGALPGASSTTNIVQTRTIADTIVTGGTDVISTTNSPLYSFNHSGNMGVFKNNITNTAAFGINAINATLATSGVTLQYGPIVASTGTNWRSNATAAVRWASTGFRTHFISTGNGDLGEMEFLIANAGASLTTPSTVMATLNSGGSLTLVGNLTTSSTGIGTVNANAVTATNDLTLTGTNLQLKPSNRINATMFATTGNFAIFGGSNQASNVDPNVAFSVNRNVTFGVGTVTNTASGTTVTGTSTKFKDFFKVGDQITIVGESQTITAIASNTSMTTTAWTNAHTSQSYTATASALGLTATSSGLVGIGTVTPTAFLQVPASIAGYASFRIPESATAPTTLNNGDHWNESTNHRLMFRQNGVSVEFVGVSAVNTVTPTAQNITLTVVINGTTYYITAKTTND